MQWIFDFHHFLNMNKLTEHSQNLSGEGNFRGDNKLRYFVGFLDKNIPFSSQKHIGRVNNVLNIRSVSVTAIDNFCLV